MNCRARLAALLLSLSASLCASGAANAQIDGGRDTWYLINDPTNNMGDGAAVGSIHVTAREASASSYTETWYAGKEYWYLSNDGAATLEIRASSQPGDAILQGIVGMHHIEARAAERAADDVDLLQSLHETDADIEQGEVTYVKEIWQAGPHPVRDGTTSNDSFELVGFICATDPAEGSIAREVWLLGEGYVYPSAHNGVRMQLRPMAPGGAETLGEVVLEASALMRIHRYIRVEMRDLGEEPAPDLESQAPHLACAYGEGARGGLRAAAVGLGLAALAASRRRRAGGRRVRRS